MDAESTYTPFLLQLFHFDSSIRVNSGDGDNIGAGNGDCSEGDDGNGDVSKHKKGVFPFSSEPGSSLNTSAKLLWWDPVGYEMIILFDFEKTKPLQRLCQLGGRKATLLVAKPLMVAKGAIERIIEEGDQTCFSLQRVEPPDGLSAFRNHTVESTTSYVLAARLHAQNGVGPILNHRDSIGSSQEGDQPDGKNHTVEAIPSVLGLCARLHAQYGGGSISNHRDIIGSSQAPSKNWEEDHGPLKLDMQLPGLCWLYTVTGYLEWLYERICGVPIRLSKQELLDNCAAGQHIGKTFGFYSVLALKWVWMHGLCEEKEYPRQWVGVQCERLDKPSNAKIIRIGDIHTVNGMDHLSMLSALAIGPLVATLDVQHEVYNALGIAMNAANQGNGCTDSEDSSILAYALPTGSDYVKNDQTHAVLLYGWHFKDSDALLYRVMDPMVSLAPGCGRYFVKQHDLKENPGISYLSAKIPILEAYYTTNIYSTTSPALMI